MHNPWIFPGNLRPCFWRCFWFGPCNLSGHHGEVRMKKRDLLKLIGVGLLIMSLGIEVPADIRRPVCDKTSSASSSDPIDYVTLIGERKERIEKLRAELGTGTNDVLSRQISKLEY